MEATDPASGQVFLEHVATGESRWKGAGKEAAAGAAGPVGQATAAGSTETGGAARSGQKVGTCSEESVTQSKVWTPP